MPPSPDVAAKMAATRELRPLGRHGRLSSKEQDEFETARRLLPGGALGGNRFAADARFVFQGAKGARFWDVSDNEYVDYCLGSGAMVLGHAHDSMQRAVVDQIAKGTHYFAYLNEPALVLAEMIARHVPCVEKLRFTVSGSEATLHAIRLARGFTGREKIIKFEGAYHGHHDYTQISTAPKRESNFPEGAPDTAGIPKGARETLLISRYNDLDCVRRIAHQYRDDLAAIIVEPIQRIISPRPGFLAGLRQVADDFGCVLIFDEVVTGWRLALGPRGTYDIGAQKFINTVWGHASALRTRGMEQIVYAMEDVKRIVRLGGRGLLISDEGMLILAHKMRQDGIIPPEVKIMASAHLGHNNPVTFRLLEDLGADTIATQRDLDFSILAAMRAAVKIPLHVHIDNPQATGGFIRVYDAPEMIRICAPVYLKTGSSVLERHGMTITGEMAMAMARQVSVSMETIQRYFPEAVQTKEAAGDMAVPV